MTRRGLCLAAAVALLSMAAAAPAFEPAGCSESNVTVASLRETGGGLRGHCDFLGTCPPTPGGCVVTASVQVSGTGLIEAQISGPFGDLRCPLRADACALSAVWHLQPGTSVFECTATGVAAGVEYACSVAPA